MYRAAFPDLRFDPQDVIATDDKVVVRVRATGTNTRDFARCVHSITLRRLTLNARAANSGCGP